MSLICKIWLLYWNIYIHQLCYTYHTLLWSGRCSNIPHRSKVGQQVWSRVDWNPSVSTRWMWSFRNIQSPCVCHCWQPDPVLRKYSYFLATDKANLLNFWY